MEKALNQNKKMFFYEFAILGKTVIAEDGQGICEVKAAKDADRYITEETPLIKKTAKQIEEYLSGKRKAFDVPLSLSGTDFQQKIYKGLISIQFGKTVSYKQLAGLAERPAAVRAAGAACGKNPLLVLVPCHRCIAADGGLTGFAAGIDVKRQLLKLEGADFKDKPSFAK